MSCPVDMQTDAVSSSEDRKVERTLSPMEQGQDRPSASRAADRDYFVPINLRQIKREVFTTDHEIQTDASRTTPTELNNSVDTKRNVDVNNKTLTEEGTKVEKRERVGDLNEEIDIEGMIIDLEEMKTETLEEVDDEESAGEDHERFGEAVEDWMQPSDSDDDLDGHDLDNDAGPLPTSTARDARIEPSCAADLSLFQAQVLEVEDACNDAAIREIAADYNLTFDWTKDISAFTGRRETFTGTPGPTVPVTDQTTMLDVFYRMFDSDFIDDICTATNRFADQKIALLRRQDKLTPNSRLSRWTPTNRDEMISYLAILILQDLYPLPEEESYFSFNGFGTMPYFSRIMSHNRFLLLESLLHFVDNETLTDDPDRFRKIRPVTDYFNDKFSSLYKPSQEISIDESLLTWRGRLSFAQKVSTKAARGGVKTYELCESSTGYLWKFFVYAGKKRQTETQATDAGDRPDANDETKDVNDNNRPNDPFIGGGDARPTNATAKIVYDLIEPLLHLGHTVIMDSFYNCPLLLRCLKRQKTDCYGTLRLNREFVPDSMKTLTKTDLRRGEVVAGYCSDLAIMVWREINLVSLISTYHDLQIGTQGKYNRVAYKPQIVLDYNKSMGGVDRKDQFLSAQPVERLKNMVWYKKVFQRLFSTALFNCFVIFATQNSTMSHRQFRRLLAENLLLQHRQIDLTREPRLTYKSKTGQISTVVRVTKRRLVDSDHFPVRTGKSRFRCCLCSRRKVESRTVWKCEECNVPLCIDFCFRSYHRQSPAAFLS